MTRALATASTSVKLSKVSFHFGEGPHAVQALDGVDLDIAAGEFVSILGPSGCGKSTILNAIGGFGKVSAGEVHVGQARVTGAGPDRGIVFQQHTLLPWKTVVTNVEFGLKMRGVVASERREAARAILQQVGLGEFLHHYPHQLSGGMQQRVNLVRVLINRPGVILMDEPFCSLDAQTRLQMQQMLLELWHSFKMTVVFVTHDVDEALFLSDRVLVLSRRPARVLDEFAVPFARPRSQHLLTRADFTGLKRRVLDRLLDESRRQVSRAASDFGAPAA